MPTRSQVLAALCQAEAFAARHDVRIHCTMPIPHCMVDEAGFPHVDFGVCSAATDQGEPAIDPTGSVKLCTLQRESIGSLFDRGLRDLLRGEALRRARERLPAFCAACPHGPSCRGGCGAAAEWVFSNPNALDPFLAQHVEAQ
jgi:radical SAM protein with 4Fe4S-binding SPASM domain